MLNEALAQLSIKVFIVHVIIGCMDDPRDISSVEPNCFTSIYYSSHDLDWAAFGFNLPDTTVFHFPANIRQALKELIYRHNIHFPLHFSSKIAS